MKNRRNYYRILQVQPDAPLEIIRACYKTLMRELRQHPDLGGEHWNAKVLNEAYATLSDEQKRRQYDQQLFEQYTKKPFSDPLTNKAPLISVFCPFCKRPLARRGRPAECCPTCRSPLQSLADEQLQHACRRSQARIKKSGTFYYYTAWPQKRREACLVDVSPNGLRFQCNEKLLPDMLIKISGSLLKGVARIMNIHKIFREDRTVYSVGAEFVSVAFKQPRGGFYSSSA
ncbi:MAG: J domain-containing protein [bacterium]